MKMILAALASASLLAAPMASQAQSHGGGHGRGGGAAHAGAFRGGGGGHFHGGYGGYGGYRHGHGYGGSPYAIGAFGLGLGLSAAFADPWYYGYPGYYGYSGYPAYGYSTDTVVEEDHYYDDQSSDRYDSGGPAPSQYQSSPQAQQPQVCGSWSWDAHAGRYNWIAC